MSPITACLKPVAFLTLLTTLSFLIMRTYNGFSTLQPSFDYLISGNLTGSTALLALRGLSPLPDVSVLSFTPDYTVKNVTLLILGIFFSTIIFGRTIAYAVRIACVPLDKVRYTVLAKHDVFQGMMVASELWPKESKHLRAATFADTATLVSSQLEDLSSDTALQIHFLTVITDMLSEMTFTQARLATFNEDLANVRRWHALAVRRMTACDITLAHLSPTRERFEHGLDIVRSRLTHTTLQARRDVTKSGLDSIVTFTAHRSLLAYLLSLVEQVVLWRYSYGSAQSYMTARVHAPQSLLERLKGQLASIPELLDGVALRIESARGDLPAESASLPKPSTSDTAPLSATASSAVIEVEISTENRGRYSRTSNREASTSNSTKDRPQSHGWSVRFTQSPARADISGAT